MRVRESKGRSTPYTAVDHIKLASLCCVTAGAQEYGRLDNGGNFHNQNFTLAIKRCPSSLRSVQ